MNYLFVFGMLVFTLISGITLSTFAIKEEKEIFNNGECPNCGCKWMLFDTDSQGGRGYKCAVCEKYIWVSYKLVDTEFLKKGDKNDQTKK